MLKLCLGLGLVLLSVGPLSATTFQTITCKDGNLLGIQELVDTVQKTAGVCKSSTSSRVDLVTCVYKELRMADDGDPSPDKIKHFLEKVHGSKIMNEARDLVKKLRTCAENYAATFSNVPDLEENAAAFRTCFMDATNKFVEWAKSECHKIGSS